MKLLPAVSIVALSMSSASAQYFEPAAYHVTDGFSIMPQVSASLRYDDNIYNDEDDGESSAIFIINPSINFGTDDGINQYGGFYGLTAAFYDYSSDDNFLDHELQLFAHTEYSAKHRTDFNFDFSNIHEDRGSGLTESSSTSYDEPLKYNELFAQAYYQHGGVSSIMRVGAGISYADKSYQNFSDSTQYSDFDSVKFFADADYQVGSVTFLTFDLYSIDVSYAETAIGSVSKDNNDISALLGLKWEGLGKTTGTMKAGFQSKDFDASAREDFTGATIDFGLIWQPLTYSSFTAHVNRAAKDSSTVGDYIETLGGSLVWQHDWSTKISTTAQYFYTNEDYVGAERTDDTSNLVLNVTFDVTRWMQLSAGYEFTTKDSDADSISYDKNAVIFSVVGSL